MKVEQISSASSKELVAFYNKNCECFGKKPVVKFSDRMTAEIRVKTMIEDIEAEQAELAQSAAPSQLAMCLGLVPPSAAVEGFKTVDISEGVYGFETHKQLKCPKCGIHLTNGVGHHLDEVNGKKIHHKNFEFECLACGEEFGPAIKAPREVQHTGEEREAMKTSLKLDRTITCVETGEVWKNAYQMWKEHTDWMTSAQQDGLTTKLYKAAKEGNKIRVTINMRTFELVNV